MKLRNQKRISADLFKSGKKRVWFSPDKLSDIKQAITKEDLRALIAEGIIRIKQKKGVSKFRLRKKLVQKRKGRQKGKGKKKGKATARLPRKRIWINKVRVQREFLSLIKEKKLITPKQYLELRKKIKGGFFRSKRHLKLFLEENYIKDGKK